MLGLAGDDRTKSGCRSALGASFLRG